MRSTLIVLLAALAIPGSALAQTTTTEQTITVTLPAPPPAASTTPTETTTATDTSGASATTPSTSASSSRGSGARLTGSSISPVPAAVPRATRLAATGADPEMLILAGLVLMAGAAGAWFGFATSRRADSNR